MKLSELVAFRNRLDELPVSVAKQAANHKLNILMHTINHPAEQSMIQLAEPFIPELEADLKKIQAAFDDFSVSIEQVKKHVRDQIAEQERHWFQESYRLFEEAELSEKTPQILRGRQVIGTMSEKTILHARKVVSNKSQQTIDAEDTLRARLSTYADWRWPGMIIRPGLDDFIENMVGCDPLYIIDREHELLEPCLERFPKLYQNRVRKYITNDWSNEPILSKIPENQFGVCLAYNVFDFRPLEIIRRYVEEIYQKLRPGGVLLMTFNDCDREKAVILVEQFCASYTPGYLIRELVKNIGFEITYSWDNGGPSVWLELHKPGQLESIRGGQTIAKIHHLSDYFEDVDFLKRKTYNKEEIIELRRRARELNVDKRVVKQSKPYELQNLINEILKEKYQQQCIENEKQYLLMLQGIATKYNIDINLPNWKDLVGKKLAIEEKERHLREEEEKRIAAKIEAKRIAELHQRATEHGIDPSSCKNEQEIINSIAEVVDRRKKEELQQLRKKALELSVGDPNLIKYGYSAEKLKQLIKAKEENK